MLVKSALVTQMSGSIGGMTGSHNKGGMYLRARSIPTDPQTSRQTNVRDMMTMYSQMWSQVLSAPQRAGWDTFAGNVPIINPLGDSILLSGQQHYLRANVGRSAASTQLAPTVPLTSINTAPTIMELPMLAPPTVPVFDEGAAIQIGFDDTNGFVDEPTAAILIYMGRPRNPGREYFKGPYRLVGMIQGDAVTAPTSPATLTGINPETIWPGAVQGLRSKLKFVLTIGGDPQPCGQSAPTYVDTVIG